MEKQAPRVWYQKLVEFLSSASSQEPDVDPSLFVKHNGKKMVINLNNLHNLLILSKQYSPQPKLWIIQFLEQPNKKLYLLINV